MFRLIIPDQLSRRPRIFRATVRVRFRSVMRSIGTQPVCEFAGLDLFRSSALLCL